MPAKFFLKKKKNLGEQGDIRRQGREEKGREGKSRRSAGKVHASRPATESVFVPAARVSDHPLSPVSVAARWLASVSPSSAREYDRDLGRLLEWITGRGGDPRTVFALSPTDAADYAAYLRGRYSPATVSRALDSLSSYWEHARREARAAGIDLQNPWKARETPRPKVAAKLPWRMLTEDQIHALLAACGSLVDYAVILGLYHTGLRVSELAAAKWSDLRETPQGYALAVVGKGSKTRVVGVSLAALDTWRRIRRTGNPYLIPGAGSGPVSRVQLWRIVKRVARDAGIPDVSPHWLRHSNASHALHHGADIATVMASLGHADLRTTSKYLHANPVRVTTDFIPGADRRARK